MGCVRLEKYTSRNSYLSAHWGTNWGPPLNPSVPYCRVMFEGFSGHSVGSPWCRETRQPVEISTRLVGVEIPVWSRLHAEKNFLNIVESSQNQIVLTIFRLIWHQTDVRLVPNQSENGKYNPIPGWLNKISKKKLSVCVA